MSGDDWANAMTRTMLGVLKDCGATIYGVADEDRIGERVLTWITRIWRGLFAYQIILVAVPK